MALDWYLMGKPHDIISGFESDALRDFGIDGFMEALDSDVATNVVLCNYDLSERSEIRAIIQHTTQDTKLKTLSRQALVPIGTCKAGMYIYYKNRYWLIVSLVDDNKVYEKAILSICNYLMTWINSAGEIIQRWAHIDSASQYNNGETNMTFYYVRSDQLMIYMPDDTESLLLDSGKRFVIDKRCKIYEKEIPSGTVKSVGHPLTVYDLTRRDSVLDDYQDGGLSSYLVTQTEQQEYDGYYLIDGNGYWLAEKPGEPNEPSVALCEIERDSDVVYIDLDASIFTARFYTTDGTEAQADPVWSIDCDFLEDLNVEYVGRSIMISTENDRLRNKTFTLTLSAEHYEPSIITIWIREFF